MDVPAEAAKARTTGDLARAITLYHLAETGAETTAERLHFAMRRAYCLVNSGQYQAALDLANEIVVEARGSDCLAELCDGLSLVVDDHMMNDRVGEATSLLAEARYVLDQLPDEPAIHQIVHNLAVTYQRCDFPDAALELFDRALKLAGDLRQRQFVLSGMAGAHHLAMIYERDVGQREQYIEDGIRVTTEVLTDDETPEYVVEVLARSHRAAFYNALGRHDDALADALRARQLAEERSVDNELVLAILAEATARWHRDRDPVAIELIERAWGLASGPWSRRFPAAAWPVQLEALWETGQLDKLRRALAHRQAVVERDLRRERAGRLAHLELGVEHRRTQRISETDPLTGLYNRRYLAEVLPDALQRYGPVCVAVFDLDGFKVVNDVFSYEQGDRVIQQIASVLQVACRRGDFLGRLGGDEFVMVLCQISPDQARTVLSRIAAIIAETQWEGLPRDVVLTSSVGVAVGRNIADAHRVIAEAGNALRIAKRSGRNRIVFA